MTKFGSVIRKARKRLEMSLQDVGSRAGLSKAHVWELERGRKQNPTVKTILNLAITLELDPGALAQTAMDMHRS